MPISAVRSVSATGLWRKMLVLETGFGPLRIGGLTKTEAAEMCQGLDALMRAYARDDDPAAALRLAGIGAGSAAGDHPVAPLTPADIEAAEATDGGDHASRELRELRDEVEGLGVVVKELRGRVDYLDRLLRANVDVRPTTNRNPE
ncbi:MAG: hypothetical protein ACOC3J_01850 [Gemmatimonadota bacterium]